MVRGYYISTIDRYTTAKSQLRCARVIQHNAIKDAIFSHYGVGMQKISPHNLLKFSIRSGDPMTMRISSAVITRELLGT